MPDLSDFIKLLASRGISAPGVTSQSEKKAPGGGSDHKPMDSNILELIKSGHVVPPDHTRTYTKTTNAAGTVEKTEIKHKPSIPGAKTSTVAKGGTATAAPAAGLPNSPTNPPPADFTPSDPTIALNQLLAQPQSVAAPQPSLDNSGAGTFEESGGFPPSGMSREEQILNTILTNLEARQGPKHGISQVLEEAQHKGGFGNIFKAALLARWAPQLVTDTLNQSSGDQGMGLIEHLQQFREHTADRNRISDAFKQFPASTPLEHLGVGLQDAGLIANDSAESRRERQFNKQLGLDQEKFSYSKSLDQLEQIMKDKEFEFEKKYKLNSLGLEGARLGESKRQFDLQQKQERAMAQNQYFLSLTDERKGALRNNPALAHAMAHAMTHPDEGGVDRQMIGALADSMQKVGNDPTSEKDLNNAIGKLSVSIRGMASLQAQMSKEGKQLTPDQQMFLNSAVEQANIYMAQLKAIQQRNGPTIPGSTTSKTISEDDALDQVFGTPGAE